MITLKTLAVWANRNSRGRARRYSDERRKYPRLSGNSGGKRVAQWLRVSDPNGDYSATHAWANLLDLYHAETR
jgi:hypothetical protein